MSVTPARARLATAALLAIACASSPPPPPPSNPPPRAAPAAEDVPAPSPDVPAAEDVAAPEHVPAPAPAPAPAPPSTAGEREYRGRGEGEWIRLMHERPVLRTVERFHSTLYVFRMDLGDGVEISFQPEQRNLETFWRREIAAWHLARVLGIEHRAPPTIGKRVPLSAFGRLGRGVPLVVDREGMVYGSASVWVPELHGAQMHTPEARRVWSAWMNPANPIPERSRERARQVAEVLVFDYLAANYDRWNCCNITTDEADNLVFRDNDGGFNARVINTLGSPSVTRRVPRYLYASIQRATADVVRASIATDPMARRVHLVSDEAWAGYERRRAALLASLRRMIERHGEAAVLYWP